MNGPREEPIIENAIKALQSSENHIRLEKNGVMVGVSRQAIDEVVQAYRSSQADNAEWQEMFDLQHKRTHEADKLWQAAHNKPDTLPDLGELVFWLLKRAEEAEAQIEKSVQSWALRCEMMDAVTEERDSLAEKLAVEVNEHSIAVKRFLHWKNRGQDAEKERDALAERLKAAEMAVDAEEQLRMDWNVVIEDLQKKLKKADVVIKLLANIDE